MPVITALPTLAPAGRRARYRAYRRRQALLLAHLMPREAIRPLMRAVRARAALEESTDALQDPLDALVDLCEELLPLPPFDVWSADEALHPETYLDDMDAGPMPPAASEPVVLHERALRADPGVWIARLVARREADVWRGLIEFTDPSGAGVWRTASIFCEESARHLIERFSDFDDVALTAFLRSSLP